MSIRLLILEPLTLVRTSLQAVLSVDSEIEVIGATATEEDLCSLANTLRPDVILMESQIGGVSTRSTLEHLRFSSPDIKIFVLSEYDEPELISNTLFAGAHAYILKQISASSLIQAIHLIMRCPFNLNPGIQYLFVQDDFNER